MKVTLDSHDPLADALRVISSLYGVSLTAADGRSATSSATRPCERAPSKMSVAMKSPH